MAFLRKCLVSLRYALLAVLFCLLSTPSSAQTPSDFVLPPFEGVFIRYASGQYQHIPSLDFRPTAIGAQDRNRIVENFPRSHSFAIGSFFDVQSISLEDFLSAPVIDTEGGISIVIYGRQPEIRRLNQLVSVFDIASSVRRIEPTGAPGDFLGSVSDFQRGVNPHSGRVEFVSGPRQIADSGWGYDAGKIFRGRPVHQFATEYTANNARFWDLKMSGDPYGNLNAIKQLGWVVVTASGARHVFLTPQSAERVSEGSLRLDEPYE